jgi:hypothetical protein
LGLNDFIRKYYGIKELEGAFGYGGQSLGTPSRPFFSQSIQNKGYYSKVFRNNDLAPLAEEK